MSIRTAAGLIHCDSGKRGWRYGSGSCEVQKGWALGTAMRGVLDQPQMNADAALAPLTLALHLRVFFVAGAAS